MSAKKQKLIFLDTQQCILRCNKRRITNTLVQELTFENVVEYRGMFLMGECDFKNKKLSYCKDRDHATAA